MKNLLGYCILLYAFCGAPVCASDYDPSINVLDWADEFNGSGLPDENKWDYEVGYVRNNEVQKYVAKNTANTRMEDGCLIIEASKNASGEVSSASIITLGKRHFFHGRIEVRAKVPTGKGTWPAIWCLGINREQVSWPRCGEIDIMEYVGYDPQKFHHNVHTLGSKQTDVGAMNTGTSINVSDAYTQFHVFALERTADTMKFFIDGKLTYTYKKDAAHPDYWHGMDQPHYLLINLAIGGSWGGQQGVDDSIFPAKYYIDYVRYYVAADSPRKYVSPCGSDLNDGNSWETAYASLGKAISHCDCSNGGEVWVASGTYRELTAINMRNNLTIRGGFAGFETSADQREFAAPTILSGSNARRIFFNSGLDSSAVVESVTFSEGFADMGGAVYNDNLTSAKFINCNFKNNSAATNGGAVFNNNSSAYFERCIFEKNSATSNGGGAVYNNYFSAAKYESCEFRSNTGYKGAGVYNSHEADSNFNNCIFANNSTAGEVGGGFFSTGGSANKIENSLFESNFGIRGGAAYISYSEAEFVNCTFTKNRADGIAAISANGAKVRAINCTFAGNTAEWGGCLNAQSSSEAKIANSIFWDNTGTYATQINSDETSGCLAANSVVQGGYQGENISANNPKLMRLSDNGGIVPTMALPSDSPAIGVGTTETIFGDCIPPNSDARGKPRNSPCSAGAFEYQFPVSYDIWAEENLRGKDSSPASILCCDAISNLQRYAQAVSVSGIDASLAPLSSPHAAPIELCSAVSGAPTLKFRRNKYMDSSVEITPFYSTDMINWIPLESEVCDDSLPDAYILQTVPANTSGEKIFFRLNIEKTLD